MGQRRSHGVVRNASERIENGFENDLCALRRNCHSNLFPDGLFGIVEFEVVVEVLKSRAFTVGQSTILGPQIEMRAPAAFKFVAV